MHRVYRRTKYSTHEKFIASPTNRQGVPATIPSSKIFDEKAIVVLHLFQRKMRYGTPYVDRYIFGAAYNDIEKAVFIEALKAIEDDVFADVDSDSVEPLADDISGQGRVQNLQTGIVSNIFAILRNACLHSMKPDLRHRFCMKIRN
jgi:hypothetical protein